MHIKASFACGPVGGAFCRNVAPLAAVVQKSKALRSNGKKQKKVRGYTPLQTSTPMNPLGKALVQALARRYESKIMEAGATLQIYLTNPVGIGEHPQHLDEMDKLLETMASSHDKLMMLRRNFSDDGSTPENAGGVPEDLSDSGAEAPVPSNPSAKQSAPRKRGGGA